MLDFAAINFEAKKIYKPVNFLFIEFYGCKEKFFLDYKNHNGYCQNYE